MAYSLSSGQEIVQNDPFAGIEPQLKRIQLYTSPRLFDVFINHRGPDVKDTLALQLYNSLQEMELRAFLDSKEMELGDSIPSALKNAIRSASVHIAIFTRRYAYSPWCLAELTLMLQTRAKIIPVFYDVDPFDIRYIEKGVYADAFVENKKKGRYVDMLEEWKEVLRSVSFFSGYEFKKHNYDHNKLCKSVVSVVLKEVEKKKSIHVAKYTVKLEKLVEDFETWCDQEGEEKENTNIVGIFGMGGSGKTTLAKELYNCKRSEYNASCFLYDVREAFARNELLSLQNRLLKDLVLEDPPKFQSIEEGSNYLRQHLKRGSFWRFLIVIDDIDHEDQLDHLCLIDTLSAHSLVIVTTRDERLLKRAGISIRYKMKPMDREHSRELFCWHAFRRPDPPSGYGDLVERFVEECGGLPLSLQVLGSHVCGGTDKFYWQLVLDKVRKILPHDIKKKLKISFDSLDDEQKQIFMDISCFFIGKEETMAIRIWEGSGWSAMHSLQTLKDKCLVEDGLTNYWNGFEVEKKRHLRMHDHLRDMGRGMADELSYPHRLWRPRYLESLTFKGFQSILAETNGRCFHSIFDRSIGSYITYFLGNSDDRGQSSTSLLWLELDLYLVELANIPSWIPLQNLECLKIRHGHLEQLWQSYSQAPLRLKELHLYGVVLAEIANSLGMLNQLEKVVLNVTGIPIKVWSLLETLANLTSNLRSLVVRNAVCVGNLALNNIDETVSFRNEGSLVLMLFSIRGELALNNLGEFSMSNLEKIELSDQELVSNVIISGNYCPKLHSLRLDSMKNLIELNLKRVTTLKHLELWSCGKLSTVLGISSLSKLVTLDIDSCPEVQDLTCLAFLSCLEIITIDGCYKLKNITCIEQLEGLKRIHLSQADRAIQSCLHRLQRLPSEFTVVIERAINGATEALNANLFSDVIGAEAFYEIDVNENGEPVASLKTPHSLSAIIICTVIKRRDGKALEGYDPPVNSSDGLIPLKVHFSVNTHNRKQKKGEDSKESLLVIDEALSSIIGGGESLSVIDEGEWIVTIVITEEKVLFEISNDAQYFARYSDWTYFAWLLEKFNPTFCSIEKGCIVSVNKGEEWKTLYVLKILTAKLYKWS